MTNERLLELPKLLREAERRVNNHVWGTRAAIVTIPADPNRDVDMLLLEAAAEIERRKSREDQLMEFLRSFISGGSNQDFKPWASELYRKLYSSSDEPSGQ